MIFGLNGYIWIGVPRKDVNEQNLNDIYSSEVLSIDHIQREAIARTRNIIVILDKYSMMIDQETIAKLFESTASIPANDIIWKKLNPYSVARETHS